MYQFYVKVPRVTEDDVKIFERLIPSVRRISTIPIVDTDKQAIEIGMILAQKIVNDTNGTGYTDYPEEVVRNGEVAEVTDTGWEIRVSVTSVGE